MIVVIIAAAYKATSCEEEKALPRRDFVISLYETPSAEPDAEIDNHSHNQFYYKQHETMSTKADAGVFEIYNWLEAWTKPMK